MKSSIVAVVVALFISIAYGANAQKQQVKIHPIKEAFVAGQVNAFAFSTTGVIGTQFNVALISESNNSITIVKHTDVINYNGVQFVNFDVPSFLLPGSYILLVANTAPGLGLIFDTARVTVDPVPDIEDIVIYEPAGESSGQ